MVTKRTGRPRGRPKGTIKGFLNDEDRYVIGMVFGLVPVAPNIPNEYLIMWAIYFHRGHLIEIPAVPLKAANRLKLSERVQAYLREGYKLVTWSGNEPQIESHVDTIRKKIARLAERQDPATKKWLYYARLGWAGLRPRLRAAGRVRGEDNPVRNLGWRRRGLSAREALDFQPHGAFIFANVVMDARKISRGAFMNGEVRSVRQVIFGKPKGDALIQANDLFDII